jgi:Flp pilus assembly protein TadD
VLGKYNEAITLFDKVLAVDPTDVKTLNNKGNALDNLGKHQEAI